MSRHLLAAAALLLAPALALGIPISDLHQNTSTGVPTLLGSTVTVSGVATVPVNLYATGNLDIYVQDETGGVDVFVFSGASLWPVADGDSLTVTTRVAQYNGLTELGTSTSYTSITIHGPAAAPPEPATRTCLQVASTWQAGYVEPDEGLLVRLDGLSITSGTWPSTAGGNSILTVTDGSGSCTLYIDADTPVNGSPAPSPGFSLIGIVKQYDSSSPYTSGYEIVPRYTSDVIEPGASPEISGKPVVTWVTDTTATVEFATTVEGSSEVEYGLTAAYGQTAGDAGAETTTHVVELTGLTPDSIYHFRAKSTNAGGTAYGGDQLLATASDTPGEIHVLMRGSAEHAYAMDPANEVADGEILSARLSILINEAQHSVDACLYSFSLVNVRTALINAHNRGCDVRLIIDAGVSTYSADLCAAAGIPYITSTYGGNHASGIMHDKFVVVDGRDADPSDDWVWTGSANMSVSGDDDLNNALRIKDHGLARAYTLEFDEMWGSSTQTPNASLSRMGSAKLDDTPHRFLIAGVPVEQYMSPTDDVTGRVIDAVGQANHDLYFAMLAFTHNDISDAMRARRLQVPALQVAGVFDQDQQTCTDGGEYWRMHGDACAPDPWSTPADVWLDTALSTDVLLHHKYLIVDAMRTPPTGDAAKYGVPQPLVITGSHNWSYSAATVNDENTLVLASWDIANQYLQEFAARYHEAGGTAELGVQTSTGIDDADAPALLAAARAWPNPFNPQVSVAFTTVAAGEVDVAVFDARGRRVRSLKSAEPMAAGLHLLAWDGCDDAGRAVASGGYVARVVVRGAGAQDARVVRMTLVR